MHKLPHQNILTSKFLWSQISTKLFTKLSLFFCLQTFSFIYYTWIKKYLFNAFRTLIKWILFNLFDLIYFLRRTHHLVSSLKKMAFILSVKNFLKLMYMATPQCLQPQNQVINREEESGENLRSNCVKKRGKNVKLNRAILRLHPLYTYYIKKKMVLT